MFSPLRVRYCPVGSNRRLLSRISCLFGKQEALMSKNKHWMVRGRDNVSELSDMHRARRGRDRMTVGFTTICAFNAYYH